MYSTRTRVHARISNGHPREEKRASTKVRGQVWRAERRLPREDSRAEVGEEVRVGVGVGPVEFKLMSTSLLPQDV